MGLVEEGTDAVINFLASNSPNILNHRSYFGGTTEQDEHLVQGMRSEIVYEPVGFEREVLPRSLEVQAESVKALVIVSSKAEGRFNNALTATQTRTGFRGTAGRSQGVPAACAARGSPSPSDGSGSHRGRGSWTLRGPRALEPEHSVR